jgi:hypothetical protein
VDRQIKQSTKLPLAAWRVELGKVIRVPAEKERIARALGVSEITLWRWTNTNTEPRASSLKMLPGVVSTQQQARLAKLIRDAYDPSSATDPARNDVFRKVIPPEFTARVLAVQARTSGPIWASAISNLVLREAIDHLDGDHLGMEITIVQCTPPVAEGVPVRSLFERIGVGTPPWKKGVGRRFLFLGAESLCGYVVETGDPQIIQNLEQEQGPLPVRLATHEKSAAAYPLLKRGRIAGCFLVSSSQRDFFTPECTDLVEQYANMAALAYYDDQFYRPKEIRLEMLPPTSVQNPHMTSFLQRVQERRRTCHLSQSEVELCVVQEIEKKLLQESVSNQETAHNGQKQYI